MAKVTITENILENIATAIRAKAETEDLMRPSEMPAAINAIETGGYPEPTGTINITQNGTENVKDYAAANVNVPNSYSASDEGKVVDNGALVAQGSQTITQNGTYDTTLIAELVANISGGGGAKNILSGKEVPTASVGNNGDIYLLCSHDAIQPLGDEYINTGYVFNINTEIRAKIVAHKNRTNNYQFVFGSRNMSGVQPSLAFSVRDGGTWRGRVSFGTSTRAFVSFPYEEPVELVITPSTASYTAGSSSETLSSIGSSNGTQPLYLFGFREGTSDAGHYSDVELRQFSIYESDTLIKNFVPHIDSNDTVCLLETVSGDLYYGEKTAGFRYIDGKLIINTYLKVNGAWQNLIGSNIDDVNTGD